LRRRLKLLLDENLGLRVYEELKRRGYEAQTIILEERGASDEEVARKAIEHGKIIVTMDKDFGYLAQAYNPPGIVLLRSRWYPRHIPGGDRSSKINVKRHALIKAFLSRPEYRVAEGVVD